MIANSAPVAWLVKRNENRASRNSPCLKDVKTAIRRELFTLFNVERYASEPSIVFLELQFFPARPAQKYVIDITRLLANEKRGFLFLLALGHFIELTFNKNCVLGHLGTRIMGISPVSA